VPVPSSDMQAALAEKLVRAGLDVLITNQRSVAQILATLRLVARIVDASERAEQWIECCLRRHREIADAVRDLVIGSWCGKKFRPERVAARPGWSAMPAVQSGCLFEIKSCDILQPGPAALTDGLEQLHRCISRVACAPERASGRLTRHAG